MATPTALFLSTNLWFAIDFLDNRNTQLYVVQYFMSSIFQFEKLAKHTSHFVQTCFCSLLTEKDACQYFKIFFQYITTGPFPQDTICHINLSLKLCISHSPTNFAIYIHYYIVFWLIYFQGALGAYLNSDQANLPQMSRIMHSLQLVMSNLQTLPVPPSSLFPLSFSTL